MRVVRHWGFLSTLPHQQGTEPRGLCLLSHETDFGTGQAAGAGYAETTKRAPLDPGAEDREPGKAASPPVAEPSTHPTCTSTLARKC